MNSESQNLFEVLKKQREWIDNYYESHPEYSGYLHKKLPLSLIPEVDIDVIINLTDWKKVEQEHPKLNRYSSEDELADAHCTALESCSIGYDDNDVGVKRGSWNIYSDDSEYFKMKSFKSPYNLFIEAFVDWLTD